MTDLEVTLALAIVIDSAICGFISNSIGTAKGRPRWYWAGILFGPLGVLWIVGMPARTKEEAKAAEAQRREETARVRERMSGSSARRRGYLRRWDPEARRVRRAPRRHETAEERSERVRKSYEADDAEGPP